MTCGGEHTLENRERYLSDESRLKGRADSISFPADEEQLQAVLRRFDSNIPLTVQGGRTGITGGAVPCGGHIINLERMNRFIGFNRNDDDFFITVEPGVILGDLHRILTLRQLDTGNWSADAQRAWKDFLKREEHFWPPDPTEVSATLGGIAASGGQGPGAYKYGPTARWMNALRWMDDAGEVHTFVQPQNSTEITALSGSCGNLGIITRLNLLLCPVPESRLGVSFFFFEESAAASFVDSLPDVSEMAMVEFADTAALQTAEQFRAETGKQLKFPAIPEPGLTLVYCEMHGEEEAVLCLAEELLELAVTHKCNEEMLWSFEGGDLDCIRTYRHLLAESVNFVVDRNRQKEPALVKLSTDMSLPESSLQELLSLYRAQLNSCNIPAVIFGHAGSRHLHINFLPENRNQLEMAGEVIMRLAEQITGKGGESVTEHGTGRLHQSLPEGALFRMRQQERLCFSTKFHVGSRFKNECDRGIS